MLRTLSATKVHFPTLQQAIYILSGSDVAGCLIVPKTIVVKGEPIAPDSLLIAPKQIFGVLSAHIFVQECLQAILLMRAIVLFDFFLLGKLIALWPQVSLVICSADRTRNKMIDLDTTYPLLSKI